MESIRRLLWFLAGVSVGYDLAFGDVAWAWVVLGVLAALYWGTWFAQGIWQEMRREVIANVLARRISADDVNRWVHEIWPEVDQEGGENDGMRM
jgi:hypothetical protein